ncbi:MAG TPA: GNAT family N-acetyltransferase [Steroidobacteraceae bacterium]|jgi:GNAT superfamily N-acetyltransferase|nr:GNAT family N-acetyltransferase [Steroidobacteraceae bacterium]
MSAIALTDASPRDVEAIASLHAQSWRNAYRGMLADDYLDRHVEADRLEFWRARFANVPADRRLVLQASVDGKLMGFVCVLLDADVQWGARLDNLHVSPESKGTGIGYTLFQAAREWIANVSPGTAMYLWCVERNHGARRFYERQGGKIVETATRPVAQELAVPELRYCWPPLR